MQLEVGLKQSQVLSQRMIQSAEILQMTSTELSSYINELALENPVIDIKESRTSENDGDMLEKYQWLSSQESRTGVYQTQDSGNEDEYESNASWNFDADGEETLQDYMWSQIICKDLDEKQTEMIKFMLECLDGRGYFTEELEVVAEEFNIEMQEAENMLKMLQSLEPAGVCARNLGECLQLQLERRGMLTQELKSLVTLYLEQMANNQLPLLAKELNLDIKKIDEYCRLIKSLNPKPGTSFFDRERLKYIIPDVTIVKFKEHFEILLNDSLYPEIEVNGYYRQLSKNSDEADVTEYLQKKIQQTEWIRQCIAQRNKTLIGVSKRLLEHQERFFTNGISYIVPLKMSEVADDMGIHESTVSRAVKNKYLQCAWGMFPMSFFFSKGLSRQTGSSISVQNVKTALREIIENEDKLKPYSDRILADKLGEMNISISRRTVAKYREQEKIPDAGGRKQYI